MGFYFAFFVVALFVRERVLLWSKGLTATSAAACIATYFLLGGTYYVFAKDIPGARFITSIAGVAGGVALTTLLVRAGRWFAWVRYLGTKTMPIYPVHYMPVAAIAALLTSVDGPYGLGFVAVPLTAAVAIAISLLLDKLLRNTHGIFDKPSFDHGTTSTFQENKWIVSGLREGK